MQCLKLKAWDMSGPNRCNFSLFRGFDSYLTGGKGHDFSDKKLCNFKTHMNDTDL